MLDFCAVNPAVILSVEGSKPSRTRLYRIVIATYLDELSLHFEIVGVFETTHELFIPDRPYERLLIRKI